MFIYFLLSYLILYSYDYLRSSSSADLLCGLRVGGTGVSGYILMRTSCQWITRWEGGPTRISETNIRREMPRNLGEPSYFDLGPLHALTHKGSALCSARRWDGGYMVMQMGRVLVDHSV